MYPYKKVVIKIGTNVITKDDGFLNISVMKNIVDQIATLTKKGIQIVVVTSGAMGAGRGLIKLKNTKQEVITRQALAAVGQVSLMATYAELFKKYSRNIAQVLATKEDFRDRKHYLNMKQCIDGLLNESIVPILNENDVVAVEELMFTDNDELAGLVASMIGAEALIILSNIDGVYDKDPRERDAHVVFEIDPEEIDVTQFAGKTKSTFGRGGMSTKLSIAKKCAETGINAHIVNGTKSGSITDIFERKKVGTTIVAKKKKMPAVKKWIAHSVGHEKGVVHVNDCAEPVLRTKDKAISLLPVGITKVEGKFEKGDIIKIKNHVGKVIGIGKAEYNSELAKARAGKKGERALVHYDYLVLL